MIFFIDTIISIISANKIACDVMCVQYVQKQPPEVFFKKGVLKVFAHLTGKHVLESLFRPAIYLKETPTQMFSSEIRKILQIPILKNICGRQLIK